MKAHYPAPATERGDLRYALRYAGTELSRLEFRLFRPTDTVGIPVRVLDFNHRGFAIRFSKWGDSTSVPEIEDPVELVFENRTLSELNLRFRCRIAHVTTEAEGGPIFGLSRIFAPRIPQGWMELRHAPRMPIPAALNLTAATPHPLLYGHQTRLRLVDINLGMGYCLETQDPLFLAAEGGVLPLQFSLPGFTHTRVMAKVTWVQPIDRHRLRVGIQIWDMPFGLYQSICRLMLATQVLTPGLLREAGFYIRHVREDIRFRQAHRLEEYAAILALRTTTFSKEIPEVAALRPEAMAVESDAQSRILAAWHGDRVIGSLALFFPQTLNASSDLNPCVQQGEESFPLPLLTECIELRQLCIADDFRGTDVLQGLMEHAIKAFLLSDRTWLLAAVQKEQAGFYLKMGMSPLGVARNLSDEHGHEIHILGVSREEILHGFGMPYSLWLTAYGELVAYILKRNLLPLSLFQYLRLQAKLAFLPIARRVFGHSLQKAYREHLFHLRRQAPQSVLPISTHSPSRSESDQDWSPVP